MIHDRFGGSGRSGRLCEKAPPPQEEHLSMRCVKPLNLAGHQQSLFLLRYNLYQEIAYKLIEINRKGCHYML